MRYLIKAGIAVLSLFIVSQNIQAQTISIPDTLKGWNQSWVASLNGSQATYSNWSQGGVSSVSGTASSLFTVLNRKDQRAYGFRINLKYGQSNIKGEGVRKTDDLISVRNRFTYDLREGGELAAYAAARFQTQFDKGYDYDAKVSGGDSLKSDFFAPAYITESIGMAYTPKDYLTLELGVGLKQTIVNNDNLTQDYGLSPGENFKLEGGVTTGINFQKKVAASIQYSSSLETFTNPLIALDKTDVMWSNEVVGQINKIVSASFQFELKYDEDFSSQVQLKQVLSAGISVNLY